MRILSIEISEISNLTTLYVHTYRSEELHLCWFTDAVNFRLNFALNVVHGFVIQAVVRCFTAVKLFSILCE